MSTCPSCDAEVPTGSRWCAICHVNVVDQQIGRLAPPVKRLIAFAIDFLLPVLAFFSLMFGPLIGPRLSTLLAGLVWVIAITFLAYVAWAFVLFTKGTTPGKKFLGMRVVKEDGRTADFFYDAYS